ncbi:MAG: rhamnulokinase [Oscillospiraceae bacterium]|nr:rhamnulokinase [Oscillospiraceae bacterium]
MKKVLIFDFGASSGRALLCSYENRSFVSTEIHRFNNNPITVNGTSYWNIDMIFREVDRALDKAADYGYDAVSVDTWGVDFALLDKDGAFVQKPVCYRDGRTDGVPEKLFGKISEKELYMKSGIKQMSINTMYQLLAVKEKDKELLSKAHHLLMMPDLINYRLTGVFANEYTEATTTGLIDPVSKDWNRSLIEQLGLPKRIFGKLIMPGETVGNLKAEYTDKEIPVYAAPSHDTASAVLAVPSTEKNFAFISCGTWALFGTELGEPIINNDALMSDLTNEGGYGGTVAFLKNITGTWFLQECRRYFNSRGEVFTFNDMEAFARSAPAHVAKINPNDPDFMKPGDMPQKVIAYCERTGQTKPKTIAQTLRVIYESLAAEFASTLESLESITGSTYPSVYIIGGGSQDRFLCQLTANATGRTVIAGPTEATAIGNAMCSLIAMGEIKDVAEARAVVRRGAEVKEYLPDAGDGDGRR